MKLAIVKEEPGVTDIPIGKSVRIEDPLIKKEPSLDVALKMVPASVRASLSVMVCNVVYIRLVALSDNVLSNL